jgi:RNA polymerase sigma-70 factor (ECF subfamily)
MPALPKANAMTAHAAESAATAAVADTALAERVAARDVRAFEELMRLHNRRLFRTARAILKSDADAEDAVQDAYIAAYRGIGAFRGDARLSTWLTRIVVNEAYGRLRKAARAQVVALGSGVADEEQEAAMTASPTEAPDLAAQRAELRRLLERHIDALPEQFRTVFMLRDVEELTVEEVASTLGIPEATVRTRAFRARALLRSALAHEIDVATVDAFGFAGERCDRIVASVLARVAPEAGAPDSVASPLQGDHP